MQITGCQVGEQDGVLWGRVGEMTKGQKGSFESAYTFSMFSVVMDS